METLETQETVTPDQEQQPSKSKIKLLYILIFLLILIIGGLLTFIYFVFAPLRHNEGGADAIEKYNNNAIVQEKEQELLNDPDSTDDVEAPQEQNSELKTYVNEKLGFSIDIPTTAVNPYGACKWVEDETKSSYRPKEAFTPVTTFEDNDSVYIAFEYSYELAGREETDGYSYFSKCEKKDNSLTLLKSDNRTWHIVTQTVKNDAELTTFIKEQFGSSCNLGEKKLSAQAGVFDVAVKGDGLDMEFSNCVLNYMFVLKYSPEKQKVYTFDRGQSTAFFQLLDFSKSYDDVMEESFKIL